MFIESAFLKLPELMLSNADSAGRVEAMVVQKMVTALQMELNSRSIPFSYSRVVVEKPYQQRTKSGTLYRADLLFDAQGCVPGTSRLYEYGFREKHWLEAKSFFSRGKVAAAKTQNVGRIVKDMIRLCLLPEELQGKIRQNSRYLLLIFDKNPSKYLTLKSRAWLNNLFEQPSPKIIIDLCEEKQSLLKPITRGSSINATIELNCSKLQFEPEPNARPPIYWGYLLRIDSFSLQINGISCHCVGGIGEYWGSKTIQNYVAAKEEFINLLKIDSESSDEYNIA